MSVWLSTLVLLAGTYPAVSFRNCALRIHAPSLRAPSWLAARPARRASPRLGLRMETGRELIARVAGPLGERGVPFEPGGWAQADSDAFHDPAMGATQSGYTAMLIVPTGVGAKIGGFAGDALPVARVMSSLVDTL